MGLDGLGMANSKSQPPQLWLSAAIYSVALVLVSRDIGLYHVQPHPTWFDSAAGCRS